MPKLLISLPDAGEVVHELSESTVTIGRVEDNALQIDDASVSSHHAEIRKTGAGYVLKDLGSTNGTFINGEPLSGEHTLEAGDRVVFGKIEASYATEESERSKPLPREEATKAAPAASSHRPEDFGNASPFQNKRKKKSPADAVALALTGLAVLAFAAALYSAHALQTPSF